MGFYGFGRVRSVHPSVLAERGQEPPTPSGSPTWEQASLPEASRSRRHRRPSAPVLHGEVLGVHRKDFASVPSEVWNHLVAALRETLADLAGSLDQAYAHGFETNVGEVLDKGVPAAVQRLGRDVLQSLLCHERCFFGSRLQCNVCNDGRLEYQGDKPRTIVTRLGSIRLSRAYYHCGCGHSVFPLDELLGLGRHGMLPDVQQAVALLASRVPYAEAVETVKRLLPVQISSETAQRVTATVAAQIKAEQDERVRRAFGDPRCATLPVPETAPRHSVAVIAADGGMCRIRGQETFSEFKLGVLGTLDPAEAKGERPARVHDKHYVAHFAEADRFFEYLTIEYHRMGLNQCSILHPLGDGALWLWSRFEALRQDGQEFIPTLDFFHAAEHLSDLAKLVFPDRPEDRQAWCHAMTTLLKSGKLDQFFHKLEHEHEAARAAKRPEVAEAVAGQRQYFRERKQFLNYDICLARGLPIGSGIVEGGVRFVGKDRLHRTGMQWHIKGAEAILQLRCHDAGRQWDAFFKSQGDKRLARFEKTKAKWLAAA